ncbi:hypothetical protein [Parapedobacter tibetensis]|uniref:hypothetical protein n=1 Tax=Parapedobacter tibetensis TaxID=2972951 RepID=UPI00214D3175|nr:hypothetical protein [Parapedobacter tibetensis]
MTATEFVTALRGIPIEADLLKAKGVSDAYIEDLKKGFNVLPKMDVSSFSTNPVLELVERYDCSMLSIGMIEFNTAIEETEDYFIFGRFEVDELAVYRLSEEIVMLELGSENVICCCACNGSSFLDAISIAAVFFQKSGLDDKIYYDEQLNIQMAEECGDAAGGEKYADFYRMMFGV